MAAHATRSASGGGSPRHLLELSHDELGVIVDGLADPLQPVVAVALSSTCLGLRTPLQAALVVLKGRHERAAALCRKLGSMSTAPLTPASQRNIELWGDELRGGSSASASSCAEVGNAETLLGHYNAGESDSDSDSDSDASGGGGGGVAPESLYTTDDMATLNMILRTMGLPRLQELLLGTFSSAKIGDAGVQALCEGLGCGAAPSLRCLHLDNNQFGPVGAEALATALGRGAMPKLAELGLGINPIGNQGVAALDAPLRKLPALKVLRLNHCEIGDEGVASLVADLGKDDFKALEELHLEYNEITDAGAVKLVAAIDVGGLPKLVDHCYDFFSHNAATATAIQAVQSALAKRSQSGSAHLPIELD